MNHLTLSLKELYLTYINDFLTVEKLAEYYNLDIDIMRDLLEIAKKVYNS